MMNYKKFLPVFFVLAVILFSGCELERFDLTVKNGTDHTIWVYPSTSKTKASDSKFRQLNPDENTTFDSLERNTNYYLQLTSEKISSDKFALFDGIKINTSFSINVIYKNSDYQFSY
ncbi:MAG: hypothetical protein LBN21_12780 [Treponema sp.]|jgi:hypothetical protein|nr:hypothetical protein [Treponema sp.]